MVKKSNKSSSFFAILAVCIMLSSAVIPIALAVNVDGVEGFDKGPSYKPVVPMKKVTFVNFDENSYLDDYAYLAAVPTSVFDDGDKLFSNPLLFYQDDYDIKEEREITLDARKGLDYLMEDWMSYCDGRLDQMTLINVPKNKLDSTWNAKEYAIIENDNPYNIASELALNEWSYSEDAVIAVIEEDFEEPDYELSNELEGTIPVCGVNEDNTFELKQTNSLNPVYNEFTVGEEYKYMKAEVWWDCIMPSPGMMIPVGDPDIQLYCKYNGDWMQAAAASYWNVYMPAGHEFTHVHVYKPGSWKVGITDFPTEGDPPRKNIGSIIIQGSALKAINKKVTYYVDITMYPGIDLEIQEIPPFGCRDADFKLTWDNPNIDLGFSVMGPAGEVIHTITEVGNKAVKETTIKEVHFKQLGECLPGEHYSVSVFSLDNVSVPVDFKFEYSWGQNISENEGDSLTSATEGAVLASILNVPLLYTSTSTLSESTRDVLYKLGVESVYLVNFGKHASEDVVNKIGKIATITEHYNEVEQIYDAIRDLTGTNDMIYTTIDPWTRWYMAELKPGDETEAALFIGPAAYIAAHHGSPVIIIDNHPRLSSAVVWHNEFWSRIACDRYWNDPSVSEMYLTGKRIWDFVKMYNFDNEGLETIITVADQYDIGTPWDRIFVGVANSGRFCGTPVDISCWISRSMFYPAMIFVNPALQGEVTLINGSLSHRSSQGHPIISFFQQPRFNTLVIDRESGKENFKYPILCSFVSYQHRFNERASKYYGCTYECADGLTPGVTPTMESIDQGSIEKYTGKDGAYFPDMTEIEIIPFYLRKGGYSTAFSTDLSAVVDNLNQGVIMWIHDSHGTEPRGGCTLFWDPEKGFAGRVKKGGLEKIVAKIGKPFAGVMHDENPAWVYEWMLGSTTEPDSVGMDVDGRFPFTSIKIPLPALGQDWVIARRPVREILNRILFPNDPYRPFKVDTTYDGVISTSTYSRYQTGNFPAIDIEEGLGNLHSAGFITGICQTSNTYFHTMLVRHGSVFQVQDPWPTSWYSAVWKQSIPRDIILGYTVGEAYTRGMSHVSTLYLGGGGASGNEPQWWWDTAENVVYFGDPNLRLFVPGTEYSDANNWDRPDTLRCDGDLSINGHMPFGATSYPHEKEPLTFLQQYFVLIIAIAAIVVLVIVAVCLPGKNK